MPEKVEHSHTHTGYQSLSSVVFKASAKGEISFEVKVYNEDPDAAYKKALELEGKAQTDIHPRLIGKPPAGRIQPNTEEDVKA